MMTNQEIAEYFELLSKLMDIHGADSFRAKSYGAAAFRIAKLPMPLSTMDLESLKSIPAIGASTAQKIIEIAQTGKLATLEEYLAKTPQGVVEMLSVKGIGPKKIGLLWKELGIESIGELEYACQENRLTSLKGFGAKTQSAILEHIGFLKANSGYCLYAEADTLMQQIGQSLHARYPNALCSPVGDYRLQRNVLDKLEWLCTLRKEDILNIFADTEHQASETPEGLSIQLPGMPPLKFSLVADKTAFYLSLFKQSGSASFIEAFEQQYSYPSEVESEADIFQHNKLTYIPPALREQATILAQAAAQQVPELLQVSDIKGIIHSHSSYSDGQHSLEQMATAARDKGYEYLVISDHSQAAFYANGLSVERIYQQHAEIDALNQKLAPFKILKGIESDILSDGRLDYEDEVLQSFDLVIASVHSNLKMTKEKAMQRLLAAIAHPATTILGHPTGRLLLSRNGYPVDHKTLIDACAHYGVAIEINAHPRRLDLDWTWIEYALSQNVLLSVNPDAHSIEGMDLVRYGVYAAQKGGLSKDKNLSSWSLQALEAYLAGRKKV